VNWRYSTPEQPIHYCAGELLCLVLIVLLFKFRPQLGIKRELYGIYISDHSTKKPFFEESKHNSCLPIHPIAAPVAVTMQISREITNRVNLPDWVAYLEVYQYFNTGPLCSLIGLST
jgi:hypothetical protein